MSAPAAEEALLVGSIVPLLVSWGSQSRLRCPACQRFMARSCGLQCRCGAVYVHLGDGDDYVVEALP